jgi:hypothetical protein
MRARLFAPIRGIGANLSILFQFSWLNRKPMRFVVLSFGVGLAIGGTSRCYLLEAQVRVSPVQILCVFS